MSITNLFPNKEQFDTMNVLLASIASQNEGIPIHSWSDVQALVRRGLHSKVFSIGDQLSCQQGETTLVWDIIGFDHDTPADATKTHSLTLQLHSCLGTFQLDAAEALYYAETGLAAGTYHFTLPDDYDVSHGGGKTYQFTLAQAVPAGGQIMFPWGSNDQQAAATKISTYPNQTSKTAIETVPVSEGSGGSSLGTADGTHPGINHAHKIRLGSNRYSESDARMWLNSDQGADQWWTPINPYSRPSAHTDLPGFLSGLDADFLAVIGKTKKTTELALSDGGGSETVSDRFFLLSLAEVYGGNPSDTSEPYPYYSNYSDLSAASSAPDSNRIKYLNGSAAVWWLRSPRTDIASQTYRVNASGNLSSGGSVNSHGMAPACNVI